MSNIHSIKQAAEVSFRMHYKMPRWQELNLDNIFLDMEELHIFMGVRRRNNKNSDAYVYTGRSRLGNVEVSVRVYKNDGSFELSSREGAKQFNEFSDMKHNLLKVMGRIVMDSGYPEHKKTLELNNKAIPLFK